MSDQEKEAFSALLRQDLRPFIEKSFQQTTGGENYQHRWFLDALAHKLMAVERGDIKNLLVSMPPRTLKSKSASVAFPAWVLGRNPNKKIITVSYGEGLAYEFSRHSREIMSSAWYRQAFPGTVLSTAKQTEAEFFTTAQGARYAAPVGGQLTGIGGDLIIVDDPIKAAEGSSSPTARQNVNDWFANTLVSRLNDQSSGAIIVVMQRFHLDDLVGHLLEQGGWDYLSMPAEAPTTLHYRVGPKEEDIHAFSAGSLLDPVRLPKEKLDDLRRQLGPKVYAAQYLQSPVPDGGAVFDWKWFRFFNAKGSQKPAFDFVFQSWDEASSLRDDADYSVCTTWGVIRTDEFYLLDVRRVRKTRSGLVELAKQLHDVYAPDVIVVETTGLSDFYRSLAEAIGRRVLPYSPKGDKVVRAEGILGYLEEGRVFVPREAPWLEDFRKEVILFPGAKHDDQVDSMVQFLTLPRRLIPIAQRLGRRHQTDREFEIKPYGPVVEVKLIGAPRRLRPFNSLFRD